MTLEENFKLNTREYIFYNDKILLDERNKIYKKIQLKNYDPKNNESLKNIKFSDLNKFDYFYKTSKIKPISRVLEKNSYHLTFINGKCEDFEDKNIEIRNLLKDDLNIFNSKHNIEDDIVLDFNKLFLNSGIFVNIKENANINLHITNHLDKNFTVFQNNLFNFQKNSQVNFHEEFKLEDNSIYNIKNNIKINQKSEIKHNVFQSFSNKSKLYLTSNTIIEEHSAYTQNIFNFADGFVRNYHYLELNGENASATLKGCFFLKDQNICSNKTYISHNAENCQSNQTFKGILNDESKANYYSNTIVSSNAQKTEGYQLSKGILLTDNCSFFSKPELRIYTDDVKCSHGSTIGPVDESALYYLRSRGINKNQAMKMIISSFIKDDLNDLDEKNYNEISKKISKYLKKI
tara:strand:- start:3524 stop:4738 length:1215 start_codon:yes stop_codon:yes gene_type:complete